MMNEVTKHNIHEKAMEWVRFIEKDWISAGLDLEEMFNLAWLRYGLLIAYRVEGYLPKDDTDLSHLYWDKNDPDYDPELDPRTYDEEETVAKVIHLRRLDDPPGYNFWERLK